MPRLYRSGLGEPGTGGAGGGVVDTLCICTYHAPMPSETASPSATTQPSSGPAPPLCHCQSLRQAARRATALYDAAMAPFGLRISQFAILVRLRQHGPMGLQALAAALVLDRTTLGRNLLPLERDGLVASEPDALDRRVRRLVLTVAGLALMRKARPAWEAAQRSFEAQVGPEPAMALRQELHRLTTILRADD